MQPARQLLSQTYQSNSLEWTSRQTKGANIPVNLRSCLVPYMFVHMLSNETEVGCFPWTLCELHVISWLIIKAQFSSYTLKHQAGVEYLHAVEMFLKSSVLRVENAV